jgi:hypothetical protein
LPLTPLPNQKIPSDGSVKKVRFLCGCGSETEKPWSSFLKGKVKTCGSCNLKPSSWWSREKFGKLRMAAPEDSKIGSNKRVEWRCDCGRTTGATVFSVTSGATTSCGKCSVLPSSHWASVRYGRLRMKDPQEISAMSGRNVVWSCSCGGETILPPIRVVRGNTKSCGKCRSNVRKNFLDNLETVRGLRTPISRHDVPHGLPQPVNTILNVSRPFDATCPVCGSPYSPRWDGIRLGKALTCGCSSDRISSPQREIYEFLLEHGAPAVLEGKVGGLSYDVLLPGLAAIELHGLRWHSDAGSLKRDLRKKEVANASGLKYVCVYEDEWLRRPIRSLLLNTLSLSRPTSVRPSSCRVYRPGVNDLKPFYEQNHYIGWCSSEISYGVEWGGKLVACMSFSRPKRQSSHRWEIVRMASDPGVRVHGLWGKLFSKFLREESPSSVVSFSDNRLFSGAVYGKMDFVFDGDVRPDYYWVRGSRRFHKSGLRKTPEERSSGLTELELRESQGFRRIWDLGKKRWVWRAAGGGSPSSTGSSSPTSWTSTSSSSSTRRWTSSSSAPSTATTAASFPGRAMSEPLDPDLIGVALEIEEVDLPDWARKTLSASLGYTMGLRRWEDVPGLLCVVSDSVSQDRTSRSSSSWSPIHGYLNSGLEQFERDFLPFVLARFACKAVRVHRKILSETGPAVLERWMWFRGSSVAEMNDLLLASEVMES